MHLIPALLRALPHQREGENHPHEYLPFGGMTSSPYTIAGLTRAWGMWAGDQGKPQGMATGRWKLTAHGAGVTWRTPESSPSS